MMWIESLEHMEKDEENKGAERKIEKENTTREIETKEDLKQELQGVLNTYNALKDLEGIGEDIGGAKKIAIDRIKELSDIGIQKGLLSKQGKQKLLEGLGIKTYEEQQIGKATSKVETQNKDNAQNRIEEQMKSREEER